MSMYEDDEDERFIPQEIADRNYRAGFWVGLLAGGAIVAGFFLAGITIHGLAYQPKDQSRVSVVEMGRQA